MPPLDPRPGMTAGRSAPPGANSPGSGRSAAGYPAPALKVPSPSQGLRSPSPRSSLAGKPSSPVSPGTPAKRPGRERKLLEEYAVGATLGEGAFGVVRSCVHRVSGKEYAVKMVDKVETPVPSIMKEAEMLRNLNHPNIVKFQDIFIERCFVCIVMEIYKGGDLVDGLQRQGPFEADKIVHVSYQMAAAIHHLHGKQVAHRDVKGDNCMMDRSNLTDPECLVVLTDFGTASQMKPGELFSSQVGTRQFWSPELYDKRYGLKVDVWAMGVLMYGLVTGRFPFRDEVDIRKKEVKIRTKVDQVCKDFILTMLDKAEATRPSAQNVIDHPYLSTHRKGAAAEADDAPIEEKVPQMIREDGANVGIKDRRHELVERLQEEHSKATKTVRHAKSLDFKPFTVASKVRPGEQLQYEWWSPEKMKSSGILDVLSKAQDAPAESAWDVSDLAMFSKMLGEHGIDARKFGTGTAKSLQQLAAEVRRGDARLMLDATAHKKLVRVVDILVLRLHCSLDNSRFIVETSVVPKGRAKKETLRLPAKIKPAHENVGKCSETVLAGLRLPLDKVRLDIDNSEKCEEEYESPSYPGVQTIYNKEIVEGVVEVEKMTAEERARIGLPGFQPWTTDDPIEGTRCHEWMTEEQGSRNIQFYGRGTDENESALVHAPIGMNEQELQQKLSAMRIDVSKFGQNGSRSLKDFSQELYRGEAFLSERDDELLRTVNVVLIFLRDSKSGNTLVQTKQVSADGRATENARLPGNKCRPDENHFICARNIIRRELEVDENTLNFDETVKFVQETAPSSNYPGIKTIYRKFLITAQL